MRLFGGKKFIPGVKIEVDTENLEDSTIKNGAPQCENCENLVQFLKIITVKRLCENENENVKV